MNTLEMNCNHPMSPNPILNALQFEVHLADECNLNCQMCDHFSPLAKPNHLRADAFTCDVARLSALFHANATYIRLLGGEPLLNPQTPRIIEIARNAFPFAALELYTNGILLRQQTSEFWNSCAENALKIIVTKYPIGFDYPALERAAAHHGVAFAYSNPDTIKTSWHYPLDLIGGDAAENHAHCQLANRCVMLKNGYLYPCTVAPNIDHFNRYFGLRLPLERLDCISIYEDISGDDILSFLSKPIPFCRFCAVFRRTEEHQWAKSRRVLAEWT